MENFDGFTHGIAANPEENGQLLLAGKLVVDLESSRCEELFYPLHDLLHDRFALYSFDFHYRPYCLIA